VDEEFDAGRFAQGFKQNIRPENVRQDKFPRVDDRPVDVGFGSEVDDALDALETTGDEGRIADVAVDEFVSRIA